MADTHNHAFFAGLACPTQVTWSKDIKQMFTARDVDHMKRVTGGQLDLGSYSSVKVYAYSIYRAVVSGHMPPPGSGEGPWPQSDVDTFGCWIKQGCPQ
jgi:hypothetical protein